ncbi:MAG: transglycosylase domain-containing protein, partial [Bacteroidetes bacterium]|nr:transglycosylase domain-containing protein [Bacteroidota bacterium]
MSANENPYPSAFGSSISQTNNAPSENSDNPKRNFKRIWFILSITAVVCFIAGSIAFYVLVKQVKAGKYGELPDSEVLENPKNPLATNVFTSDGKILGKYYRERRTNITYEELSPHLINALIATEDERFREHAGIDFRALARVAVKTILFNESSAGGGSTLSQQLAKNLFGLRNLHQHNN